MELKTARLTLLIDPNKKVAFERLCAAQDRTPSQVVRQFIRDYLAQHGVAYVASGAPVEDAAGDAKRARPAKPPRPTATAAAKRARPGRKA